MLVPAKSLARSLLSRQRNGGMLEAAVLASTIYLSAAAYASWLTRPRGVAGKRPLRLHDGDSLHVGARRRRNERLTGLGGVISWAFN